MDLKHGLRWNEVAELGGRLEESGSCGSWRCLSKAGEYIVCGAQVSAVGGDPYRRQTRMASGISWCTCSYVSTEHVHCLRQIACVRNGMGA